MPTVSIVIPALNERDGIEKTIEAVPKDELERMGYESRILVVDNDSNDGTGELARRAGAEVVFEPKRGYGSAFKAGFAHAKGDIIVTIDADATYPAEDIPRLVGILEEEKLDFLTTNRFALMDEGAMSFRNRLGNDSPGGPQYRLLIAYFDVTPAEEVEQLPVCPHFTKIDWYPTAQWADGDSRH